MSSKWYLSLILLIALLMLIVTEAANAGDFNCAPCEAKEQLCLQALSACQDVVKQEDDTRTILQKQVYTLEERQLDEQTSIKHSDTLWFIAGALLGGFVTYTLHK